MTRLGFLAPRSTLYPALSFDLTDGLKAGLAQQGLVDSTLSVESIGFGAEATDVYEKAQKLLLQGVDVVVAFMGRQLGDELAPLFAAANRLLLVLDVLGDVSKEVYTTQTALNQPVFYHSLHTTLGCWLTARTAAIEQGGSSIMATSYYDAGYPSCQVAAQAGLTAGEGQTAQYFVSSHRPELVTLETLQPTLTDVATQSVVGLFCGDLGALFLQKYQALQHRVPVYASPFMLEEQWLSTVDSPVNGVSGYVTWSEHLDLPANHQFMDAMQRVGRRPTIFSMLAWEGGLILANWLSAGKLTDFSSLATLRLDGPRGPIAFDADTHFSFGPFYRTTIVADEKGKCRLDTLTPADNLDTERACWLAASAEGERTGWKNQYLCI